MNILLRLATVLLVLTAVLVGASTWFIWQLDLNHYRSQIAALLSEETGLRVELAGALEYHVGHGLQLIARNVRVDDAGREALDLEQLGVHLSLKGLLARRVTFEEIKVLVRHLDLEFDSRRKPVSKPPREGPLPIDQAALARLHIAIRTARVRDLASPQETHIENLTLDLAPLSLVSDGMPVIAGPAGVLGVVQRGEIHADVISHGDVALRGLDMALANDHGTVILQRLVATLGFSTTDTHRSLTTRLSANGQLRLQLDESLVELPVTSWQAIDAAVVELGLNLDGTRLQVNEDTYVLHKARFAAKDIPLVINGRPISLKSILQQNALARAEPRLEFQGDVLSWTAGRLEDFALTTHWADDTIRLDLEGGNLRLERFPPKSPVRSLTMTLDGQLGLHPSGWNQANELPERVLLNPLVFQVHQVKLGSQNGDYELANGRLEIADFPLVRQGKPIDPNCLESLVGAVPDTPRLQFSIRDLSHGGETIDTIDLDLRSADDTLYLKRLEARLAGTQVTGEGDLRVHGPLPPWRLRLTSPGIALAPLMVFFHSNYRAKGDLTLELAFQGRGVEVEQMLPHLDGTFRLAGKDLTILNMDFDEVITYSEYFRSVGLLDIGAYALFGPVGILLTKSTESSALLGSVLQRRPSRILSMRSMLQVESGVVHTEDVALATPKHRLAIQGTLDLRKGGRAALEIATVDTQGCAYYVERIGGSGRSPTIDQAGLVINSVLIPVNSVLGSLMRGTIDQGCFTPFYEGQVAPPAPP